MRFDDVVGIEEKNKMTAYVSFWWMEKCLEMLNNGMIGWWGSVKFLGILIMESYTVCLALDGKFQLRRTNPWLLGGLISPASTTSVYCFVIVKGNVRTGMSYK